MGPHDGAAYFLRLFAALKWRSRADRVAGWLFGAASVGTMYKICEQASWRIAEREGLFGGTAADTRDGFIHFSTAAQLPETLAKHYAGASDLLVIAVDGEALGPQLRWERSRGGDLFPHLYGTLPMAAVRWSRPLPDEVGDTRAIPELDP
jgi:uncharacterized protein (DUF952 family)